MTDQTRFDFKSFEITYYPVHDYWSVFDLNYGYTLGNVMFESGPGAIFTPGVLATVDISQMRDLIEFMDVVTEGLA